MAVQIHGPGVEQTPGAEVEPPRRWGLLLPLAVVGIALLLPLAVFLVTVVLMGWQLQAIKTASMAPRYPAGSLAVVEPLDPADVRAGMTIVFADPADPGRLVAHRVVKRLPGDIPTWQTKGDANAEADPYPVHATAVQGRVRWAIPRLGRVVGVFHSSVAAIALIGVPLTALLVTELTAALRRRRAAAV